MTVSIAQWRADGLSPAEIIEKIKARIFDLRVQTWKLKAREQENYAILQDTEEFMKQERALRSLNDLAFTPVTVQRSQAEIKEKKIEDAVNVAMERFKTAGLPEAAIAQIEVNLRKTLRLKFEKELEPPCYWCRECGNETPDEGQRNPPTCCGKVMEKR